MEKGRTAILYFAFRPEMEAVRKPIFSNHGRKVNVQFYHDLQDELFDRLTPLGLPVIHIADNEQRGNGFAERITNAVEDVWAKGYERVIVLGNDCPELDIDSYQRCIEWLDKGNSCLIPTQHGGAGLIALHKSQYNASHWIDLEWQSAATFDELFDCLSSCKVLDRTLTELNTLADAYMYLELRKYANDEIALIIDGILNPLRQFVSLSFTGSDLTFQQSRKLRGPPFKA